MDQTVNALAGSTFDKKKKRKNCFLPIKFQVCIPVYSGLKLRTEYAKITWVGRSASLIHRTFFESAQNLTGKIFLRVGT